MCALHASEIHIVSFYVQCIKKNPTQTDVIPQALLTFEVFLAGHVVPDPVYLFRRDLVHCDDSTVPTEAVSHFPMIETTVLIRVNAKLA